MQGGKDGESCSLHQCTLFNIKPDSLNMNRVDVNWLDIDDT